MSRKIGIDELVSILSNNADSRVMVTFHSIGDTDSVSSAFALSRILKHVSIRAPDFITSNSKYTLKQAGIEIEGLEEGFVEDAELIVLVDVNNFADCGKFEEMLERNSGKVLVIDHHAASKAGDATVFNDETYNSTASIVYEVMSRMGFVPDIQTAEVLAMGIYSDSAEFKNATPKSFIQMGQLLEIAGIGLQELLEKLKRISTPEARERTVDELFNSESSIIKEMLYIKGTTSMHAAIAADDAIKIGADVALFSSESESEISFSARLRPTLDVERGLHLGFIMKNIARTIDGTGGGHPCAAGAYGSKKEGMKEFIKEFEKQVFGGSE